MPKGWRIKDVRGQKFERLAVLDEPPVMRNRRLHWHCICACGNRRLVAGSALRSGLTKSCGCYNREHSARRHTTHGLSKTADYRRWQHMIQRCYDPNTKQFKDYGGRGIAVCDRWRGVSGFLNYLSDIGPRPSARHSVDRIDNEGHYEPGNCRWATQKEQVRNQRKRARISEFSTEELLAELEKRNGKLRSDISVAA